MSKLNVDQKAIRELFQDRRANFLIPDYQRPYTWGETECQTLWDDLVAFSIPDNDATKFKEDEEYYLGPIVTFKNKDNKIEVIDGQQRLTTLMLLLRAFYAKFGLMQDDDSIERKKDIEKCLWKTSEMGKLDDINALKIDSEVATDDDKEEFIEILKTGKVLKEQKSQYSENYSFFQKCIDKFIENFPSYLPYLATRIMNNCILLPIEAESEDTALRIFSTLNDRGKPLSDADIFKAQFYKFYSKINKKDEFIEKWKKLEKISKVISQNKDNSLDELFARYMYYIRALKGIKDSTTKSLREFYKTYAGENDNYSILKQEQTFNNLMDLAIFWKDISDQNKDRFTDKILKRLFVLNSAPNNMWKYFISVYFMQKKDSKGLLEENEFYNFLNKIIGFIWTYAIINPGVSALRTPIYAEMINLVNNKPIIFSDFKFDINNIKSIFTSFSFKNSRPITRSMVAWWAYQNEQQELLSLKTTLEIEHIYSIKRQKIEQSLEDINNLETLGNKSLLEEYINIGASAFKFEDKKRYYLGNIEQRNQQCDGTKIKELRELAINKTSFTEEDIKNRSNLIIDKFIKFLQDNQLTK